MRVASDDDDALIRYAVAGDIQAFARLYDRHSPRVLALCERIVGDRSTAQDVLHDVFIEAWQCAADYDPRRSTVRTWLLVRGRSRALDQRARASREQARKRVGASRDDRQDGPVFEKRIAVREALARLDVNIRVVLELTYFEGLTAPELAERTGVPLGTVKSRLARGVASLQLLLGEWGDDERE